MVGVVELKNKIFAYAFREEAPCNGSSRGIGFDFCEKLAGSSANLMKYRDENIKSGHCFSSLKAMDPARTKNQPLLKLLRR